MPTLSDNVVIFALSHKTGERVEVKNLYWFYENGVLDWRGKGYKERFDFEIVVNGETVAMTANLLDEGNDEEAENDPE